MYLLHWRNCWKERLLLSFLDLEESSELAVALVGPLVWCINWQCGFTVFNACICSDMKACKDLVGKGELLSIQFACPLCIAVIRNHSVLGTSHVFSYARSGTVYFVPANELFKLNGCSLSLKLRGTSEWITTAACIRPLSVLEVPESLKDGTQDLWVFANEREPLGTSIPRDAGV